MDINHKINWVLTVRNLIIEKVGEFWKFINSKIGYLAKKGHINADQLTEIGNILKYNFFKHYS